MQFHAKNPSKANTALTINGRKYILGPRGEFEVTEAADIEKLQRMSGEFAPATLLAGRVVTNIPDVKGVEQFVSLYTTDTKFRTRLENIKDMALRMTFLKTMGFNFTPDELDATVSRLVKPTLPPPDAEQTSGIMLPPVEPQAPTVLELDEVEESAPETVAIPAPIPETRSKPAPSPKKKRG